MEWSIDVKVLEKLKIVSTQLIGLKRTYWTHLVSKLVKDQGRVVEEVGSDVGVEPATLVLQGLGELPVIQRHLYTRLLYSLLNRMSWQVFISTSEMILVREQIQTIKILSTAHLTQRRLEKTNKLYPFNIL